MENSNSDSGGGWGGNGPQRESTRPEVKGLTTTKTEIPTRMPDRP